MDSLTISLSIRTQRMIIGNEQWFLNNYKMQIRRKSWWYHACGDISMHIIIAILTICNYYDIDNYIVVIKITK